MADTVGDQATGIIYGYVTQSKSKGIVQNAEVRLYRNIGDIKKRESELVDTTFSDGNGYFEFDPEPAGRYTVSCSAFRETPVEPSVQLGGGKHDVSINLDLGFDLVLHAYGEGDTRHRVG